MKCCSRCKLDKPLEDFKKDSGKKDGHSYLCRLCSNIVSKNSYQLNKQKRSEKAKKAWKERTPDKIISDKEWRRNNYLKNFESIKQIQKIYNEKNRDARTAYSRFYKTGWSPDLFEIMWAKQNGLCYTCKCSMIKNVELDGKKPSTLANADHYEKDGQMIPRRILCRSCNLALGILKENKETLQNFLNYLAEFGGK